MPIASTDLLTVVPADRRDSAATAPSGDGDFGSALANLLQDQPAKPVASSDVAARDVPCSDLDRRCSDKHLTSSDLATQDQNELADLQSSPPEQEVSPLYDDVSHGTTPGSSTEPPDTWHDPFLPGTGLRVEDGPWLELSSNDHESALEVDNAQVDALYAPTASLALPGAVDGPIQLPIDLTINLESDTQSNTDESLHTDLSHRAAVREPAQADAAATGEPLAALLDLNVRKTAIQTEYIASFGTTLAQTSSVLAAGTSNQPLVGTSSLAAAVAWNAGQTNATAVESSVSQGDATATDLASSPAPGVPADQFDSPLTEPSSEALSHATGSLMSEANRTGLPGQPSTALTLARRSQRATYADDLAPAARSWDRSDLGSRSLAPHVVHEPTLPSLDPSANSAALSTSLMAPLENRSSVTQRQGESNSSGVTYNGRFAPGAQTASLTSITLPASLAGSAETLDERSPLGLSNSVVDALPDSQPTEETQPANTMSLGTLSLNKLSRESSLGDGGDSLDHRDSSPFHALPTGSSAETTQSTWRDALSVAQGATLAGLHLDAVESLRATQGRGLDSATPGQYEMATQGDGNLLAPSTPLTLSSLHSASTMRGHDMTGLDSPEPHHQVSEWLRSTIAMRDRGHAEPSLEATLSPPDLGRIRIEIQGQGEQITGRILVANQHTLQLLQATLTELRTHLSEQGLPTDSLTLAAWTEHTGNHSRETARHFADSSSDGEMQPMFKSRQAISARQGSLAQRLLDVRL